MHSFIQKRATLFKLDFKLSSEAPANLPAPLSKAVACMGCHPEGVYSGSVGTRTKGRDGMAGMLRWALQTSAAEGIRWCNNMTEVNPCSGWPMMKTGAMGLWLGVVCKVCLDLCNTMNEGVAVLITRKHLLRPYDKSQRNTRNRIQNFSDGAQIIPSLGYGYIRRNKGAGSQHPIQDFSTTTLLFISKYYKNRSLHSPCVSGGEWKRYTLLC